MTNSLVAGYALVTGAASGIGKETAFAFAEAGAKGVLFADLNGRGAEESAQESFQLAKAEGYKAIGFKVDVTDQAAVKALVELAVTEFGRIDYLVNSAGIDTQSLVPFPETSSEDIDKIYDVNVRGAFLVAQAVSRVMAQQEPSHFCTKRFGDRTLSRGSIVNVASAMSVGAIPLKTPYVTAKHALLGLTRAAAIDLNQVGVRVNCVSPTWVQTPMLDELRSVTPQLDGLIKKVNPIGRAANPDEVSAAILYLSGADATYVTGSNMILDNGLSLGPTF